MDFEKKLEELNEYGIAFEIRQGYYHVSITYNDGWTVIQPENESIYAEERNGVCHYIGQTGYVKIDEIFDSIDATINYNIDLEKKLELFKEKTAELQEIFANETYDTLVGLKFTYGKKKVKKQAKKKEETVEVKEEDETEESIIAENTNETDDTEENVMMDEDEVVMMPENYVMEEMEQK